MNNNFTDYQKDVFYDMYKTILGSTISSSPDFYYKGNKEQVILDAVKLAKVSVEILTDENGLRQPTEVKKIIDDNWDEIKGALL